MYKVNLCLWSLVLCLAQLTNAATAATSITQFGITWTFDKDYTTGTFANGDYWVVGPVKIIGINPPSTDINGRIINGSMLNPSYKNTNHQGFDNTAAQWTYDAGLNVAFDVNSSNPLTITTGSLVSTISNPIASSRAQLTDAAVLTVLASAPPDGSFRPPYSSATKTIEYNVSTLNETGKGYSVLKNLTAVAGTPSLATVERQLERPWLEIYQTWITEYLRPSNNQQVNNAYGEYLSEQYGDAILLLNINNTNENKRILLIEAVQIGIDLYGGVQEGLWWNEDGGHNQGHLLPIHFAGLALGDSDMTNVGSMTNSSVPLSEYHNPQPAKSIFPEIQETFYVNTLSVSITEYNTPIARTPDYRDAGYSTAYTDAMLGNPEYGIRHFSYPQQDDAYLAIGGAGTYSISYRASFGAGQVSNALALHILGTTSYMLHNVYFEYMDRWMAATLNTGSQGNSSASTFAKNMWNTYRANYGNIWAAPGSSNQSPNADAGRDQTVTDLDLNGSGQITLDGSGSSDPNGSITNYVWKEGSTQIATGVSPSLTLATGAHTIILTVTDNGGLTATDTVVITVNASASANTPPTASAGPDQTVTDTDNNGSQQVTLNGSGSSDPGGSITSYVWRESGTQIATGISPSLTLATGAHTIILTVTDNGGLTAADTVVIIINSPAASNQPPVLAAIGNKSVNENSTLSFSISATDPDGDTITYSAQNLPAGATFVGQTFSWTPNYSQAGSYPVTFIASDGKAQYSKTITITVSIVGSTNRPPVLAAIGNKLIHTSNLLVFNVNATDPDGDTITYSATGLPIGATFVSQNFRWTPGTSQAGTYDVTIIASDGLLQNSETITITVFYSTGDTSAPTVNGLSPAADSIQMPLDRLVILHVADNGEGVDAGSVTIKVNDNIVYTGDTANYNSSYGRCHRTGAKADYTFIYQPHAAFDYDQNVSVVVNAQDLTGNTMIPYSYSFVTKTRSFGENKMVNSRSKNLSKGHPATVQDSAENTWVAWHAGTMSSSGMRRGIYVGKLPAADADNFGTSVREADNSSDRCNAALAIDAYDKLYLAWQDNRRNKWDIYMSTSVDGINWSTEKRVTDSDSNAVNPVIAVDHSLPPKAYIAWQDDRADNQEIYIASSSDGFATETISRITSDSSDQIEPAIAVDSANTAYVVWADSRSGSSDIYGAASNNGPWANVPIVTKPGNQTNPAIATEATGTTLHLLWVDDTAGNKDIYYTASNGLPGTSLAGRNIVDDSSADQLTPVIITTGSTGAGLRVFACWQDTRNIGKSGRTDLYFAEVSHGQETNIFVGDNSTSSNKSAPVIGVDRYGYPYLVWVDDRNRNTDIYYAGSTFVHSNALVSKNISPASGTIVGTEPANINSVDDVSIVVPAGAYPCELNITISKVKNPPKLPVSLFNFPYEFGPSGADFNQPVTITIPYSFSASNNPAFAYWYNTLVDALSQQGITNVETIAISPTLYALRFKATHFTQFIVGGSVNSGIQVTKCTITAGSKDNSDKISISGKIDATADNFTDAAVIEVTVDSNDLVNPCVLTFPINSPLKKGKYSYSGTDESGAKKSFKYDVKTHSFAFAAANVNLSGLDCPLTFDINVGGYLGTAEINETIVNGGKPTPMTLLMGVQSSLRVDTCRVKPGKKSNTDKLSVKGGFAVEDTNVNMADRVSEGLVVILGTQTFTISKNDLKAGKGKFTCSKAKVTEGGVATVSFDFNKGSFIMTISNTNITASSGTVDFGVAFAGYSQIRQITLM